MKTLKIFYSCVFVLFLGILTAQPPSGKATPGTNYGAKTTPDGAIPANELPGVLKGDDSVAVKVKAKVNDVCSKKGCWITFAVNDSTEAFVKMKDYGFFLPVDAKGKKVVLDGKAFVKTTSVAELKHYAEDAKKPKAEIDAITSPKTEIRFLASGILVTQ